MRRKLIPPPIICFFTPTSPLMATNILELSFATVASNLIPPPNFP